MKRLIKVLLWIAGIVTILLLIGALLPGTASVARSITIKAPPSAVYNVINDLKTYAAWMPWNQKDSAMVTAFSSLTQGTGASYSWKSEHPQVGNGKMTIIASIPDSLVTTSIEFGGFDRASIAGWTLDNVGGNTKITWNMTADLSHNPLNRWFGFFFDKMIGPDFENGLSQLKAKIENGSLQVKQPTISLEQQTRPAFQVLTIMDTAQTSGDIGPKLQKAYGEMTDLLKAEQLQVAGMPLAWYYSEKEPYILEAAIPVNKIPVNTTGRIHFRKVPAGNAVVAHFFGPYESSTLAYLRISEFININNLKAKGAPYEVYVDDPATKKSMFEVKTDIVQPVE